MSVSAIIQARTGSSRLPGKVLLPLDGVPVIQHIIRRAQAAELVDEVIVATTFHTRDDLIEEYATAEGAKVYRGSEDDVLGRITEAANEAKNDVIVRLTGDNPFVSVDLIDTVSELVFDGQAEYASNKLERTFPVGVDAEAITTGSLEKIENKCIYEGFREHALSYVRENIDSFNVCNVTQSCVFGERILRNGPDLRLTLDEPKDYIMYTKVYNEIEYDCVINVVDAEKYIDQNNLAKINDGVKQETL